MAALRRPPPTADTYLGKLPYSVVKHVSTLLDIDSQWERFVVRIPKRLSDIGKPEYDTRYSHLQIRLFEEKSKRPEGSSTKSILDDWSTQNPRVKHLLLVLQDCALYEAADYISVNVLHGEKVPRVQEEAIPVDLPTPQWDACKKGASLPESMECRYPPDANFDNFQVKKIYDQDKVVGGVNGGKPGMYNSLSQDRTADRGYDKLSFDEKRSFESNGGQVAYNRITSFDSGGQPSVLLHDRQTAGDPSMEETLLMRPVKQPGEPARNGQQLPTREPARNGQQLPTREPCEMDEGSTSLDGPSLQSSEHCEEPTIYTEIGSQVMEYRLLHMITNEFNKGLLSEGGRLIGSGGFGDVFLGIFNNGFKVAVKRLKNVEESEKQFVTELDSLMKYRHKNIVRLFGYSTDGVENCLVYEYLSNGSLEDRLMRQEGTPPLPNNIRIAVLKGTAEGIYFLNKNGIIHRDIKSANVLLDDKFMPKVGDFATARHGPRGNGTMAMSTQMVIGTSAYLAPEAINFDVSTKLDSYSFGVVILEVLTSLRPLDHTREEKDLKSHVEESDIDVILDISGGTWSKAAVTSLIEISDKCMMMKKKARANIEDILEELNAVEC